MTLLTIEDLAERWQVPRAEAQRICRERSVPYVPLATPKHEPMRIYWRNIRFRIDSIERWEAENQERYAAPNPRTEDSRTAVPAVRRLGNWEGK